MKVIVEGTKKEIETIRQMSTLDCCVFCSCGECVFGSKDKYCQLTEEVLQFLQEHAIFIIKDNETIDNDIKMPETEEKIVRILEAIKQLLLTKNSRYGNSILDPMRVFCKKDKEESDIPARLDDKLSRIKNSDKIRINDVTDLIGYLVLFLIQLGCTEADILSQID